MDTAKEGDTTAAARVFGITELLQRILINVVEKPGEHDDIEREADDMMSLIRLRHVNTKFKEVIETYEPLRQDLFIDYRLDWDSTTPICINPLILKILPMIIIKEWPLYSSSNGCNHHHHCLPLRDYIDIKWVHAWLKAWKEDCDYEDYPPNQLFWGDLKLFDRPLPLDDGDLRSCGDRACRCCTVISRTDGRSMRLPTLDGLAYDIKARLRYIRYAIDGKAAGFVFGLGQ